MKNKAQIGLGETVAVIIVFIMIFMFVFIWYVQAQAADMQDKAKAQEDLRITEVFTRIESMPEIQCSQEACAKCGGTDVSYTFDYYKALSAQDVLEGDLLSYYFRILGTINIELEISDPRFDPLSGIVFYPDTTQDRPKNITIYNITTQEPLSIEPLFVPANIYDPLTDTCYMGELRVKIYS